MNGSVLVFIFRQSYESISSVLVMHIQEFDLVMYELFMSVIMRILLRHLFDFSTVFLPVNKTHYSNDVSESI